MKKVLLLIAVGAAAISCSDKQSKGTSASTAVKDSPKYKIYQAMKDLEPGQCPAGSKLVVKEHARPLYCTPNSKGAAHCENVWPFFEKITHGHGARTFSTREARLSVETRYYTKLCEDAFRIGGSKAPDNWKDGFKPAEEQCNRCACDFEKLPLRSVCEKEDGTAHGQEVVYLSQNVGLKNFRGMKGILAIGHNIDGTPFGTWAYWDGTGALSAVVEYRHQKRNLHNLRKDLTLKSETETEFRKKLAKIGQSDSEYFAYPIKMARLRDTEHGASVDSNSWFQVLADGTAVLSYFEGRTHARKFPVNCQTSRPQQRDHEVFVWPKGVEIERRLGMGSYEKVKTIGFDPNFDYFRGPGIYTWGAEQDNLEPHLRYKKPKAQALTCDCRQFDKGSLLGYPRNCPCGQGLPGSLSLESSQEGSKVACSKATKTSWEVEGFAWDWTDDSGLKPEETASSDDDKAALRAKATARQKEFATRFAAFVSPWKNIPFAEYVPSEIKQKLDDLCKSSPFSLSIKNLYKYENDMKLSTGRRTRFAVPPGAKFSTPTTNIEVRCKNFWNVSKADSAPIDTAPAAEEPAAEEASAEDNKAAEEVAVVEEPKPDAAKKSASSLPAGALHSYTARLSLQDHKNSRGKPIKSAAGIVQQDRANFHKFNKRDPEDKSDPQFTTKETRAGMGKLLKASPMSKDTASAIMGGTPLIKVVVFKDSIQVNIISK